MKRIFLISTAILSSACTTTPKSVYESGWNNETSKKIFSECSSVWLGKDMFVAQNLKRLVNMKYLSQEQAERVISNSVKVGDPECMVYAANGLHRSKVSFTRNNDGKLIQKEIEYSCQNSQATCPGITVSITDGTISDIRAIIN